MKGKSHKLLWYEKGMLKKIISLFLSAAIMFSLVSITKLNVSAADYDITRLEALAEKFPDGRYWNYIGSANNNPDGYTATPCPRHRGRMGSSCNTYKGASQCMGYSFKLAEEIVGTDVHSWEKIRSLDLKSLRVGDIIRYLGNGHSIVVVGVKGDTVAYTGANWGGDCLIKWGTLKKSQIKGFSYVLHDKNNKFRNDDISFFEGIKPSKTVNFESSLKSEGFEKWQNGSSKSISIFNIPVKGAFKTGSLKKGEAFKVYEKNYDGKILWGRVSEKGWVKLSGMTFLENRKTEITAVNLGNAVAGKEAALSFDKVSGAESYTVNIFKKGQSGIYKSFDIKKESAKIKIDEAGVFSLSVTAKNSKAPSWYTKSENITFEVKPNKTAKITALEMQESISLSEGGQMKLYLSYKPVYAEGDFIFESSDEKVVKVFKNGIIEGLKEGSATVTLKARTNPSVKAECRVTVTRGTASALRQFEEENGESEISLEWSDESVDGYTVYSVSDKGEMKEIADTKFSFYKLSGLTSGQNYTFNVRGYKNRPGKKEYSSFTGQVTASTKPDCVKSLKATEGKGRDVVISFAETENADFYEIYKINTLMGEREKIGVSKDNKYTLENYDGEISLYCVTAVTKNGDLLLKGGESESVYIFRKPAKTSLRCKGTLISWDKAEDATGYVVVCERDGREERIVVTDGETLSYKVKDAEGTYYVKAYTSHGNTVLYSDMSNGVNI